MASSGIKRDLSLYSGGGEVTEEEAKRKASDIANEHIRETGFSRSMEVNWDGLLRAITAALLDASVEADAVAPKP